MNEDAPPIPLQPLVGFGSIRFGMTLPEVETAFGPLENHGYDEYGDLEVSDPEGRFTLTFSSDAGFRLDGMRLEHPCFVLCGDVRVGLTREELQQRMKAHAGADFVLGDRYGMVAAESYEADSFGASFWVADGRLVHVTLFPAYDDTGNHPQWPSAPSKP